MIPRGLLSVTPEKERELRKEERELPSCLRSGEAPIAVRITLGAPTISVTPAGRSKQALHYTDSSLCVMELTVLVAGSWLVVKSPLWARERMPRLGA